MKEFTINRAALLRLFLTNPDQAFYMQEIGRLIGKKPGNFQRMINKMVEEGILISERKANVRYFRVNKDYPLYKELKSIVFKTVGVIGSLKEALDKIGIIDFAFVYGSYAKGRENYLSDIDLVIIGKIDEDNLIVELDRLEDILQREVNYKLYTSRDFKRLVKRKDPFLLEILSDKKIMIIGKENELRKIYKA
jgi:predicted nucleotidyltransferase